MLSDWNYLRTPEKGILLDIFLFEMRSFSKAISQARTLLFVCFSFDSIWLGRFKQFLPLMGGSCSSSLYCSLINREDPCCFFTLLDLIDCLCINGLIGASAESAPLLVKSLSKLAESRPADDLGAVSAVVLEAGDTGLSDFASDAEFGESIVGVLMFSFQWCLAVACWAQLRWIQFLGKSARKGVRSGVLSLSKQKN